jgi:hypothetical protein
MVRNMMDCWDSEQTSFFINQRIEQILMKAHGLKLSKNGKGMDDNVLLSKLSQMGFI